MPGFGGGATFCSATLCCSSASAVLVQRSYATTNFYNRYYAATKRTLYLFYTRSYIKVLLYITDPPYIKEKYNKTRRGLNMFSSGKPSTTPVLKPANGFWTLLITSQRLQSLKLSWHLRLIYRRFLCEPCFLCLVFFFSLFFPFPALTAALELRWRSASTRVEPALQN